jgi:VWFA-related protein
MITLLIANGSVFAQEDEDAFRFNIMDIDDASFPDVGVYVSIIDELGHLVDGLTKSNFTLYEKNKRIEEFDLLTSINKEQPVSIVMAIDIGGMPENSHKLNMDAASEFVKTLHEKDKLAVIAFTEEVKILQKLDTDKHALPGILSNLKSIPDGNSSIYDALMESTKLLEKEDFPKFIILISDGTDSRTSTSTIDEVINTTIENKIQIFPYGLGNVVDTKILDRLAEETGGATTTLDTLPKETQNENYETRLQLGFDNLQENIDQILKFQYLLSYESELKNTGETVEVMTSVNYMGWESEDEDTYIACPGVLKICFPGYLPVDTIAIGSKIIPKIFPLTPPIKILEGYIDGELFCTDELDPFECFLDPEIVSEGSHLFELKVINTADMESKVTSSLVVREAIVITVDNPKIDEQIVNKITVEGKINSLAQLEKIEYRLDEIILKTIENPELPEDGGPPFIYELDEDLDAGNNFGSKPFIIYAEDINGLNSSFKRNILISNIQTDNPAWWVILLVGGVAFFLIITAVRGGRKSKETAIKKKGAFLYELEGLYPNQKWFLKAAETRLGRKSNENDIPLKGLAASRRMALIRHHDSKYYIYSLNPQNPILVNNMQVQQQQILKTGDHIRAGESLFRFDAGK